MKALDLCTGAGGMAAGMLSAGFGVQGVDVVLRPENPAPVLLRDVRTMDASELEPVDWLHASPPCTRFSLARANRAKDPPTEADLDILRACLRIRDRLQPRFWSIENVRGAEPWFTPILGEPSFRHGPFYFWGNTPSFLVERTGLRKGIYGSKSPVTLRLGRQTKPKDPWLSARLPIELTRPMAQAVAAACKQEVAHDG